FMSGFLIILDTRTYTTIDLNRYIWNLFYFYLLGYATIMLVVAASLWYQVNLIYIEWDEICVPVFLAYGLLVRPYVFLLINSVRAPTPEMERFATTYRTATGRSRS